MSETVVFFDFETAGVRDEHAEIQLAAIAVRHGEEADAFEAKIRFDESKADPSALALNGYDREVWARYARAEADVAGAFGAFLRRYASVPLVSKAGRPYAVARLAGHNVATFDCPRLKRMFDRHGEFLPAAFWQPLGTLQLATWALHEATPRPADLKLGTLAAFLGFQRSEDTAHDALGDVRTSARVAYALLARMRGPAEVTR